MLNEYRKALMVQNMLSKITKNLKAKEAYECHNCIERFLLLLANEIDEVKIYEKLELELKSKKINPKIVIPEIRKMKISKIAEFGTFKIIESVLLIGHIRIKISRERMLELVEKAGEEKTVIMLLRYRQILFGSQHWAIPRKVYNIFAEEFGIAIEGFASPINHRLPEFCSLFPDVDKHFGSIGKFFDLNLEGKKIAANPPYTPFIMEKLVQKIEEFVSAVTDKTPETIILTYFPAWDDASYVIKMKEMSIFYKLFDAGKHYYEDEENKRIKARFNSYVFLIIINPQRDYNYEIFDNIYDI